MPRRGQCRCGAVLTVQRTAEGYKQRCPACHAVVRIRSSRKRRKSKLVHTPAPAPVPAPSPFDFPIPLHASLNPQPNPAPVPTLEPWTEPSPRSPWLTWVVVAAVVLAVLLVGGVIGWVIS